MICFFFLIKWAMTKLYPQSFPGLKNAGFTLIELLVVVLIIGILAAVALPQYEKAVMRSRFAQIVTAARSITQAQQSFYMANGVYTTDLNNLDVVFPNSTAGRVALPGGSCGISDYPERVVCYLGRNKDGRGGTLASLSWYYTDNQRLCCAYSDTDFMAGPLCRAEMKNDSWYQGCGEDSCHCYKEK